MPPTATLEAIKAHQQKVEKDKITPDNLPPCPLCNVDYSHFKLLRCIKIGEPNVNCAGIQLNPTYYMRKGTETNRSQQYFPLTSCTTGAIESTIKSDKQEEFRCR